MRVIKGLVIVGAMATFAGAAHAQSCAGFASLEKARANVGGNAWFADGVTSYGAQLNLGRKAGTARQFLSLGAGMNSYDAIDESSTQLSAGVGLEMTTASKIDWCPMLSLGYEMGPGDDVTGLNLGASVGVSKAMGEMGGFGLVPFGSVGFVRASQKVAGTSASDNAITFGIGLGLRMGDSFQLSPQFSKTTFTGDDGMFGLTLSIPFGTP
jgi:hypothetical protein